MAVFSYRAVDTAQISREGTITADTPRQARDELRSMGLSVRDLVQQNQTGEKNTQGLSFFRRHKGQSVIAIRELATLLGAGIPLLQSIETIRLQHKGGFKTTLSVIHDQIQNGSSLADALAQHPQIFDALSVHMVGVGEETGELDVVLAQLADFKEKSLHLKDRVTAALTYPFFLVVVMIGITIFLMTVVLPNLLDSLVSMGQQLPWPTRLIKGISDFMVQHGGILSITVLLVSIAGFVYVKTPAGQLVWHRLLLKLPVIGIISKKQGLGKLALVLSTLLKSGLVFDRAVQITAESTENLVLRNALKEVKSHVSAGLELGVALGKHPVFPPVLVQIFRVGQESGQLEPMLERLARDYDRQVESATNRLASLIEPVLILLLAAVVGIIMAAVVLPILEAGKVV